MYFIINGYNVAILPTHDNSVSNFAILFQYLHHDVFRWVPINFKLRNSYFSNEQFFYDNFSQFLLNDKKSTFVLIINNLNDIFVISFSRKMRLHMGHFIQIVRQNSIFIKLKWSDDGWRWIFFIFRNMK